MFINQILNYGFYKSNHIHLRSNSINKLIIYNIMTENRISKMNLEQERKIAELQERVNRLENLCYAAKEVLNLEEAASFLGVAKSTLYKMTHLNQLPYFKPAGKLIFFEKQKLIDWVRGAKSKSVDEIKEEAAAKIQEMNERQ